ncbi:hypothetical protein KSP40_PGU014682 [Platanthera guangdongensis]|uniref:Polygalacturonase n=1 Tax=Platanthera guangdongensis TaxID=2320717 RepID=A0ABR2LD04_9ASPA
MYIKAAHLDSSSRSIINLCMKNIQMPPQSLLLFLSLLFFSLHNLSCSQSSPQISSLLQPLQNVFNVDDFVAKAKRNDSREGFMNAWKAACSSSAPAVYLVPKNKQYLLKPLDFHGPCKSTITVLIMGTLEASSSRSDWDNDDTAHWILFDQVKNLILGGGGTIVGNGEIWWKSSCKVNSKQPCTIAPTALTFYGCSQLKVENLSIINSQQIHVSVEQCVNVSISNLKITAPEESPNTDGIHVGDTRNMHINGCVIRTGDDCISIVTGCENIRVTNTDCGPGHGISIGSLGQNNSLAQVSDVVVDNVTLNGTANGVRIKTWQGGRGQARNIIFQNINMQNVTNPIIIDQSYCDSLLPCDDEKSAVSISGVTYENIRGTSASKVAVNFSCSRALPCQKIKMENIKLVGEGGESTESLCRNTRLEKSKMVLPACG